MSRPTFIYASLIVAVLVGGAYLFPRPASFSRTAPTATSTISDLLAEVVDDAAFARADVPPTFNFPRDHALHEDFRTEWWYFTGHLTDVERRPYGFQLTLFRFELDSERSASPSAWRTPRMFLGHFALTDVASGRFHQFERMSRTLPGIAGASTQPPAVWLDDWRIQLDDSHRQGHWTLRAQHDSVAIELTLAPLTPVLAHGEAGLSQKSAARGNASYYYSIPRLRAEGKLELPSGARQVEGTAWLDREWSTSALDREQAGWDWFALQFDDASSLMFYRLRLRDGTIDPHSAGSYVAPDGSARVLAADDVRIEVMAHWRSDATDITYPSAWQLEVDSLELKVSITPRLAAQEWQGQFRYWEGAATFSGTRAGNSANGQAYVELTGY